ncbi:ribosomal protein MRP49 [Paramyrothecium foliicola]|nr:ribosomal protein MRP49 [Paramyrothecium foliicola]
MRSLGERLNKLRLLMNLKCGPGAAILPPEVTRIHMDFASQIGAGNVGAKKFWREQLPRLKYHNPAIPMIVNRHSQRDKAPVMSVYLRKADAASSTDATTIQPASSRSNLSQAQAPGAHERVVRIDMKDKHSSHILEYFVAETGAVVLEPTKEEIQEMQALEAFKREAVMDRERVRLLLAEKKKEQDMLKRARAAGGMGDAE